MSQTIRMNFSIVLPEVDENDECVPLLLNRLSVQKGIEKAHIVREDGAAQLCLHYDPNLIPLSTVQRLVEEVGAEVSERYRHEQIPIELNTADAAINLERHLQALNGVLHVSVNYVARLIFIAYDTTI